MVAAFDAILRAADRPSTFRTGLANMIGPHWLGISPAPPVYRAARRRCPAQSRDRVLKGLIRGSWKAGCPRLCVGNGDARGASDLTDRDALGSHFAVERGMADAVAVLELLDREKLGHLGFHIDTQLERVPPGFWLWREIYRERLGIACAVIVVNFLASFSQSVRKPFLYPKRACVSAPPARLR